MATTIANRDAHLEEGLAASARHAPFISVIVPVRNEARFIGRTLTQLAQQTYDRQRFEVIVVDAASTDGTREIVADYVRRFGNVRLLTNPRRWSSAARNLGIQHARGDLVVIVDGHCEIDGEHYLARLAQAFERSGADCIGRPQPLDVSHATPLQRAIAAARSSRLGHHPDSHIYSRDPGFVPAKSVAVAYRRSVFDRVGHFDERFDACEDVEFNHRIDRAGLTCFLAPEAAVRYVPRDSLSGLFRQLVRYGRGRFRLLAKHPDTFSLKTLAPALFVLGCILGPVLALVFPVLWTVYLAVLAAYAAIVLSVSATIAARSRNASLLARLPWVFATIHVASGAGILWEAGAAAIRAAARTWPPASHHAGRRANAREGHPA